MEISDTVSSSCAFFARQYDVIFLQNADPQHLWTAFAHEVGHTVSAFLCKECTYFSHNIKCMCCVTSEALAFFSERVFLDYIINGDQSPDFKSAYLEHMCLESMECLFRWHTRIFAHKMLVEECGQSALKTMKSKDVVHVFQGLEQYNKRIQASLRHFFGPHVAIHVREHCLKGVFDKVIPFHYALAGFLACAMFHQSKIMPQEKFNALYVDCLRNSNQLSAQEVIELFGLKGWEEVVGQGLTVLEKDVERFEQYAKHLPEHDPSWEIWYQWV